MLKTDGVSVFVSHLFCRGDLFSSFVCHRAARSVERARKEHDPKKRMELLLPLRCFESHLPASYNETIELPLALFSDHNSIEERAKYIVSAGQQIAAQHAADWDRGGTMGTIGGLLLETPPVFWNTSFTIC